jgi:3',5'-cyclic AMP phosphodiesterase CpdA
VRTIAHLSDLHFGREDPRVADALLRDLAELSPSLVAVSGDLTQRARVSEYERARDFLARVAAPKLVVPGNHDVPLFDVLRRFVSPLDRFRAYVHPDVEPVYRDEELVVVGVSTARSLTWKGGRISWAQMDRVRRLVCAAGPERLHVLVAHHPFSAPEHAAGEEVVGRAAAALAAFAGCGLDLVLSGHLHRNFAGGLRHPHGHVLARSVLALHAGSAISRRLRGEVNSFNLLRVRGAALEVELRALSGDRFAPARTSRFVRTGAGWVPIGHPPALGAPPPR